jgi:hypothetical protein
MAGISGARGALEGEGSTFGMSGFHNFFKFTFWPKAEQPVVEILVHLVVTVLLILSIICIEWLLHASRLDGQVIPGTGVLSHWLGFGDGVTLKDWMLALEVFGATAIILVGIYRGLRRS